jgi:hypothetical protein
MRLKSEIFFIRSAGILLIITSAAKLISAGGSANILQNLDPVLSISFRQLFLIAGIFELTVALVCLFVKMVNVRLGLVAWLATNLLLYRMALWWVGYQKPCSCLGNLTDAIHISPPVADNLMKGALAYLLIGSYGILFRQWWKNRRLAHGRSQMGMTGPETGGSG